MKSGIASLTNVGISAFSNGQANEICAHRMACRIRPAAGSEYFKYFLLSPP